MFSDLRLCCALRPDRAVADRQGGDLMADLIDRQVALKEAYDVMIDGEMFSVVQVETLLGLPSAEPRWSDNEVVNFLKSLPSAKPDSYGHYPKMEQIVPPADPQMSQVAREMAQIIINERTMRELLKQQRWIPVTKRLPTKEEYIANNGLFIVSDCNRTYSEHFDIYDKKCFGEHTMYGFRADIAVTAWMPLPEPYKGGAE